MWGTRRDLFQLTARIALLPGAAEFFSDWLRAAEEPHNHNSAPPEPPLLRNYQPKFFPADDFAALQSFTEILIPTDDTPGAREAHCAHFIDFLLHSADEVPALQTQGKSALTALRTAGFHTASPSERLTLVQAMARPESDPKATHPAYSAYRFLKQQNTFAYYTSRAGMIENLDYRGNSYNATFPACTHPEHHRL